ncbi:Aerobic glycerol-3-phosphate dehydrogenase [Gimesia panareensis]|uniref:Aerobic glycerol-3-phosphate dehydrogenase n=1 Tax=Gimesia panareensis TaxID=2527978 RepID=A0A518FRB8_9PLAN|nr:glycerol-3-phosphate dehydrogenase/oxidase [Gimesia panareensis]QDV18892.1 Aerobic glycerol-3-phosphate dehydrogenase [Gimesia panareensis]
MNQSERALILGAGINGVAIARELLLNDMPVTIVEQGDLSQGATSKSSRLIHGGLRYLEYGDFSLVSESVHERGILLNLAPHLVKPLRFAIPLTHRISGIPSSGLRFLSGFRVPGVTWLTSHFSFSSERGLYLVDIGLSLYDWFASKGNLPKHSVHNVGETGLPQINANKFRWMACYSDAQMRFPERFVVALLHDCQRIASEKGIEFELLTYHQLKLKERTARIRSLQANSQTEKEFVPKVIINASGACGDLTLEQMEVSSPRLMGGTKGSHIITFHRGLCEALGDKAIYSEASDGRLVFILPFGDSTLIGTTDVRVEGNPLDVTASPEELEYLVGMVNMVFPQVGLTTDDINLHYSGVRPLPYQPEGKAASISRDHSLKEYEGPHGWIVTLVGGKLTSWRAFAEKVSDRILRKLGKSYFSQSKTRLVPGAEGYPQTEDIFKAEVDRLAEKYQLPPESIRSLWTLQGTHLEEILDSLTEFSPELLRGTSLPRQYVLWTIQNEWVETLGDLVERRLMLVFAETLTEETLQDLADCLVEAGKVLPDQVPDLIQSYKTNLDHFYGKAVVST